MTSFKKTALSITLFIGLNSQTALAQAISKTEKQQVIDKVSELMSEYYVYPEVATKTNEKLKLAFKQGEFTAHTDSEEFAKALSIWLKETAEDRHLSVRANPVNQEVKGAESRLRDSLLNPPRFGSQNKGVVATKVLENNIGYMDLRGFYRLTESQPYIDSAMKLLANTDAIIIDLRKNGGGSPRTVQYLCSYFFDKKLLLNSLYYREGNETIDYYVLDEVAGEKLPDVPLYVLTSNRTASAAEEFSYNMQTRKRATLVGETTRGAANPGGMFTINDNFRMFVATGAAINPITKTNWETVGVVPHVATKKDQALDKAIELASIEVEKNWQTLKAEREQPLDKLLSILNDAKQSKKSLTDIRQSYQQQTKALINALNLSDEELAELAYESWETSPKYAVFLFEIAVTFNEQELYLYEYWARALARLDQLNEAKAVINIGLSKVKSEEHKTMLKDALTEITVSKNML
ncbi:S41 family peptidase [Pseudoalteromonas phenolica]|uniref:S41 family peptidase n=1 Tax=Pseudoalteromonas phenolica TaxID=161398 RepID=UPI00110BFAA6|nr:S41 family peptidase [Pseudoalteromonas phenolica]TMO57972.1 hypothetical protein CWC21_01590 [Pseudoalteromonas phenolica]